MDNTSLVKGAGIYAIYYLGQFPAYEPAALPQLSDPSKPPLYVGKAIPKGGRKGGLSKDVANSNALKSRLEKHARTIKSADNIDLSDFYFRFLAVDDVWIPLGENVLIERFKPIWNVVVDGFGNNDPGKGRYAQMKSSWDLLHPGREWAKRLSEPKFTYEQVLSKIKDHFV